ncbi:MAG: DUF4153 domain-containing protein, partial [Bacteroidota bacterium]
ILYVLIPLLSLYFLILYSYSIKIIALWDWPRGIITYMIIAVAVLGILAMLLAYPFSVQEQGGPIRFLRRGYFWMLIPIIVVLYLAIGIRVSEYGSTVNRYITIFLALWLSGICLFSILGGKDIRVIPISLCVIIILCSFGPWGMFSVSERSQVDRLELILTKAGILDEKIVNEPRWVAKDSTRLAFETLNPNEGILSDSLHNEVVSILEYLEGYHGLSAINSWFEQSTRFIAKETKLSEDFVAIRLMGLESGIRYENSTIEYPTYYVEQSGDPIDIQGYDRLIDFNFSYFDGRQQPRSWSLNGVDGELRFDGQYLMFSLDDQDARLDVDSLYRSIRDQSGGKLYSQKVEKSAMTIVQQKDSLRLKIVFSNLSMNDEQGLSICEGRLLYAVDN